MFIAVSFEIEEVQDQGGFFARCPELGVSTEGDTFEEAHENIGDAVLEFLNAAESEGIIDSVLHQRGVVIHSNRELEQFQMWSPSGRIPINTFITGSVQPLPGDPVAV